jgi:hypothetical protein
MQTIYPTFPLGPFLFSLTFHIKDNALSGPGWPDEFVKKSPNELHNTFYFVKQLFSVENSSPKNLGYFCNFKKSAQSCPGGVA